MYYNAYGIQVLGYEINGFRLQAKFKTGASMGSIPLVIVRVFGRDPFPTLIISHFLLSHDFNKLKSELPMHKIEMLDCHGWSRCKCSANTMKGNLFK